MPEMTPARRGSGGHSTADAEPDDSIDWTDKANWTAERLRHRRLKPPDQSRYGHATDTPILNPNGTLRRYE